MREAPLRTGDVKELALLGVARDLVERGELHATPIGQIARRANLSRQGFYFYYQSKDELLAQLVNDTLYSAQDAWRATLYDADWSDPAEAMRGLIASTVVMWRGNHAVLRAAVEVARTSPVHEQWLAAVEETAEFLTELVVSSTAIEALRDPDEARLMMVTVIWMIERNCYMHVIQGTEQGDAALARRIGDAAVRTLGLE